MKTPSLPTNFPGLASGSAYIVISMDAGCINAVQSYFRGEYDSTTHYKGDKCMLQLDIPFLLERLRQQLDLNRRLTVDESKSMQFKRQLAIRKLMQKNKIETEVYFPVEWRFGDSPCDGIGGLSVDDAGTVYVIRYDANDEELVKKTTLMEMIAEPLDGWRGSDGYTYEMHVPASDALAAALRAAADMLDAGKRPNATVNCPK